ncbi:MAG: hypothetical protein ACKVWR_11370 [Acidimicrobiales bacterium]
MSADTPPLARFIGAVLEPGCELCDAERYTHWYHEDDICWVADCEICDTPMVVWNGHGTEPPELHVAHMLARLAEAGAARFGPDGFRLDRVMRQIPTHFHAHARDADWASRRWGSTMSVYSGVGGERRTR